MNNLQSLRQGALLCLWLVTLLAAGGCASGPPSASRYLTEPAKVRLNRPLCVRVVDQRPVQERKPVEDPFWIYTSDGADPDGTAFGLANDLARVLQGKGLVEQAVPLRWDQPCPTHAAELRLTLETWFGRVPSKLALETTYTEKLTSLLLVKRPRFAEAKCGFSATLIWGKLRKDLGRSKSSAVLEAGADSTIAREGKLVTALAEDEALAELVLKLEKTLREDISKGGP